MTEFTQARTRAALAHRPLCQRLLGHGLAASSPARRAAVERAYAAMPDAYFDEMEHEIACTVAASGVGLDACLRHLDAFNALTPDAENDAWYDRPEAFTSMHLDAVLLGFARRRLMLTLAQVSAHAAAAIDVLEVGSGSGRLAGLMADASAAWRFTLVDRSAQAGRFAAALHRARGTGDRVHCLQGDLAALPAPDASADLVIAAEVLEHAPNPIAGVSEMLRVLRPGGWLAISLPIDLDIAMHPTVFGSAAEILAFFERFALGRCAFDVVRSDPEVDAIADVFPGFEGCVNAVFRKDR
jgi:SAM-dependent methyltransferase